MRPAFGTWRAGRRTGHFPCTGGTRSTAAVLSDTRKTSTRWCRNDLSNFSAFLRAEQAKQSPSWNKLPWTKEGLPRLPAQPRRNETRGASITASGQWFGAAEGCKSNSLPLRALPSSERSPAPLAKAEPNTPTLARPRAAVGEQPRKHGLPAWGPANKQIGQLHLQTQSTQSTTQKITFLGPSCQLAGYRGVTCSSSSSSSSNPPLPVALGPCKLRGQHPLTSSTRRRLDSSSLCTSSSMSAFISSILLW